MRDDQRKLRQKTQSTFVSPSRKSLIDQENERMFRYYRYKADRNIKQQE